MKMNRVKSTLLLSVIVTIFVASAVATQPGVESATIFFDLTYKAYASTPYTDYANFIKQQLARIGINVNIVIEDFAAILDTLMGTRDFDITCLGLGGGGADYFGLPLSAFTENASLNAWGYHTSMDYDEDKGTGLNEWYIRQGNLILPPDSQARIQHAWDWQNYMQTNLLPMKPFFAPQAFNAYWANLQGYNISWGVVGSWGKMSWDGLHAGQSSTSEIILTDNAWSELNPFFYSDGPSGTIIGMCLDTLIDVDPDLSLWPMVAESWEWQDDTTLDFTIRPGIKWPDYGSFADEYLDADDVYFTFYCWQEISVRYADWFFLADFEKLDDMTIRCYLDGDPSTPEPDPYASALVDLASWIAPEHFLNQTQEADGVTPETTHPSWTDYSVNCWGTDLFEIESYTEAVETVMTVKDGADESWRLDPTMTSDPALDYVNRYGDYSGGLDTLIMRIIPDQQTALLEFEAGKVDIETVAQHQDYKDKYVQDPSKALQSDVTNFFQWIGFNMRPTRDYIGDPDPCPLDPSISKGLAVRKAIAYAINRVEINEVLHNGESLVWDYPNYPTLGIWNYPGIIRYNFNLDKAREFMTKAGYDLGWTGTQPGFTLIITLSSLFIVASVGYVIIKRRK
jgi:ABC-type transport system substrate-binding protein